MKKRIFGNIFNLANLFFILTLLSFLLPSKYKTEMSEGLKSPLVFGIVLVIIEIFFVFQLFKPQKNRSARDIFAFVYGFLFIWELGVSRFNLLPYVFIPAPENVFHVFVSDTQTILLGFLSSMYLLVFGMTSSIILSVVLGTVVGWSPRLSKAIYPIAKAVSTVPALIYTPYIVILMPTFRSASILVIFLSIFWGSFMESINNTVFVEKKIINAAKVLSLSTPTILFKIIIPFNIPRIINSLPIRCATAIMTLSAAEMLGADIGMGFYVKFALNFAMYTKAIAGIIFIGLVVTILNIGITFLQKHFIKWSY